MFHVQSLTVSVQGVSVWPDLIPVDLTSLHDLNDGKARINSYRHACLLQLRPDSSKQLHFSRTTSSCSISPAAQGHRIAQPHRCSSLCSLSVCPQLVHVQLYGRYAQQQSSSVQAPSESSLFLPVRCYAFALSFSLPDSPSTCWTP